MKKKLHIENIDGGAKIYGKRSYGALKNLMPTASGLVKRNGHKTVAFIKDTNGTPLEINGIFAYSYLKNGEEIECKIVHAGNRIFKLDKDFNYICELEYEAGVEVKNERSRAFYKNGALYIIGAGDILICDGEIVRSAYFTSGTYIPTTAKKITDRRNGMMSEPYQSPNLLNPRRKNKLIGGSTHKKLNEVNIFVLDSEIEYRKPIIIDVKIRTKLSEDADNDYTTSYVGINEAGKEVSTVVNLRYVRENVDDTVLFFLSEPMRNDRGEKIKIKIGDKIHDYDTVPFGVRLKNHREICFGFDVDAPYPNEENITVEYESSEGYRDLIKSVELSALGAHAGGGELLLFTTGGNELYYSDTQNGFSYLPRDNKMLFGGADKITAVIQLWDNLVGVFKNSGFYRVRFENGGCESISSADSLGACSSFAASVCSSDCLVLGERGIYGVDDYKSSVREICLLSPRSLDIDSVLSGYSEAQKREAVSCVLGGKYYLFIGDECYVGVPKSTTKKEYEWYPWYGFGARVVSILDGEIYFGTHSGEIRKMYSGYIDITEREYSEKTLSLIIDNEGEKTRLITDRGEIYGKAYVNIGAHRLYLGRAVTVSGGIELESGALYYPDSFVKLFYGDTLILVADGEESEKTVLDVIGSTVLLDGESSLPLDSLGEEYEIYLKKDSGTYEAEWKDGAIYLKIGGERVKLDGFESMVLSEKSSIESEYKTAPLPIGTQQKNATVTKLYLNAYSGTEGEIEAQISTRGATYIKKIVTAPPLDFGALDFNRLDMTWGLDAQIKVPVFVRGFDYLDVKILSNDEKPVYIGFLTLEYYVS